MVFSINFRKLALNLIFVSLVIFSIDTSAQTEQCNQISRILKANTNGYTELVDTKQYQLQESPLSQSGRESVESTLKLPSAERCQATWSPEKAEFVYMCDWLYPNNDLSSTNLKIIGDIVEKCLVESNFKYDRVNPKKVENLSFITFYFSSVSNMKIVLMKFGSAIKSRFEFADNQLAKPESKISENNRYDPNAQWPKSFAQEEELRKQNEASKKLAQEEEKKKQWLQAQLAKQKAEQVAHEKQLQLEAKRKQEMLEAERLLAEKNEKERVEKTALENAEKITSTINAAPIVENSLPTQIPGSTITAEAQTQPAKLENRKTKTAEKQIIPLNTCWYFASYTAMYREPNTTKRRTYNAALVSNVSSIAVNWNFDLEQNMRQKLSQKATQAWESGKPTLSYEYFNAQAFGHVSCGNDAQQEIESIHKTMITADWVGQFEVSLD